MQNSSLCGVFTLIVFFFSSPAFSDRWIEEKHEFFGNHGESRSFSVVVPKDTESLRVESVNGMGDIDIFVYPPTSPSSVTKSENNTYLGYEYCQHRKQNSEEACEIKLPTPGTYRVVAKSFMKGSTATIKLSYKPYFNYSEFGFDKLVTLGSTKEIRYLQRGDEKILKLIPQDNVSELKFSVFGNKYPIAVSFHKQYSSNPTTRRPLCTALLSSGTSFNCSISTNDNLILEISSPRGNISAATLAIEGDNSKLLQGIYTDPQYKQLGYYIPKSIASKASILPLFFEFDPWQNSSQHLINFVTLHRTTSTVSISLDYLNNPGGKLSCDVGYGIYDLPNVSRCGYGMYSMPRDELLRVTVPLDGGTSELIWGGGMGNPNGSCDDGCGEQR